jgi:uroporphyrinogen-III synthase
MRVLVTRPEPDGARTADQLRARGCDVLLAPLLRVEVVDPGLDPNSGGAWDALALTSVNAVRALADRPGRDALLAIPAYAVGSRTADAARAHGFAKVVSADGDVDDLAQLMAAQLGRGSRVLYLAGEERSGDLVDALAEVAIAAQTRVVYRAIVVAQFPPEVQDALAAGRLDAVLHFSARTALAYVGCASAAGLADRAAAVAHYCLSRRVAAPLVAAGARVVQVAGRPTEAALLELVNA